MQYNPKNMRINLLSFVLLQLYHQFLVTSCDPFTHILQGYFTGTGAIMWFISYLGVKSWDLQVCDRASTITHVDREKKNSAYYNNKMFYFFLG